MAISEDPTLFDGAPARILCVDDQADAVDLMHRQLAETYSCEVCSSADEALAVLEQNGPVAVVIADYMMPGTNGVELLKTVKARWPQTVRIMITANDEMDVAISALHDGDVYRFVRKPWQASEIRHAVGEAVAYYRLAANERRLREELARTNAELDEKVQDLDEANELLEYWVEFSPAVLYSFSREEDRLRASYISKNFSRLTGYERTTAVIDDDFWPRLIVAEDRDDYAALMQELAAGDLTHAVTEYRIVHKAGAELRVIDSMRAVHDGDGQTIEVVGAWMDTSARR